MSQPASPPPPSPDRSRLAERLQQTLGEHVEMDLTLPDVQDGTQAEQPGAGESWVQPTAEGRYQLRREFARGGMGAILEVFDRDLRRPLAMKVILTRGAPGTEAGAPTRSQVDRFLLEAQVTAQLDHPGMVPVHEVGLDEDGQVYFTMKLVRGEDLQSIYERVARSEDGWSRTRALGVILRVCEALDFAHSKGVVHRDIKPANVMVGRFGEVYLMDWGLARVEGRDEAASSGAGDSVLEVPGSGTSSRTLEGTVVGTPAYMPPEQAEGRPEAVGPHSDVYSVGAMLYHLLTGRMPYVEAGVTTGPAEVLQALYEGPPQPIEELAPEVPPELVAICEKAMARDPADRYPGARALGEDLRAFLEQRVVRAYETGAWAETRKWVRRNRPLAGSLAAGVMALAAGLVASLVLMERADASAALAEQRRQEAVASAAAADRSATEARRQVRIAEEINRFLNEDMLAAVAPQHEGIDVTVREVLDAASKNLQGRFPDDPIIESELRMNLGRSFEVLGLYDQAEPQFERARELRAQHLEPDAEELLQADLARASAWQFLGRYEDARVLLEDVLERAVRSLGNEHRATMTTRNDLAMILVNLGRAQEGIERYREVLVDERRLLGEDHEDTLSTLNNLAIALQEVGDYEPAEELLQDLLERRRRIDGARGAETLKMMNNLALVVSNRGDFARAEALLREAQAGRIEVLGEDHPQTAIGMSNLAVQVQLQGRPEEALQLQEAACEILDEKLGARHPDTLRARGSLATYISAAGRIREALALYLEVMEAREEVLGMDHPETLSTMANTAQCYRDAGMESEAEALFQSTLERQRRVLADAHPDTLITLENLAGLYYGRGEYEAAEEMVLEVLAGREQVLGPQHPGVARTTYNLAMVVRSAGRPEEAADLFQEAREMWRSSLPDQHPDVVQCVVQGTVCLIELERFEEAEEWAFDLLDSLDPEEPARDEARALLVRLYEAWGKPEEAESWR